MTSLIINAPSPNYSCACVCGGMDSISSQPAVLPSFFSFICEICCEWRLCAHKIRSKGVVTLSGGIDETLNLMRRTRIHSLRIFLSFFRTLIIVVLLLHSYYYSAQYSSGILVQGRVFVVARDKVGQQLPKKNGDGGKQKKKEKQETTLAHKFSCFKHPSNFCSTFFK